MKIKIIFILLIITASLNAQTINVTFPNGGEQLIKDTWSPQNISWGSTDITNFKIEYSTDNGVNWIIIENNYSGENNYSWHTPNIESVNCLIKISDALGTYSDISNNTFEICQAKLFYAEWNTSMGIIRAELRGDLVPMTTQNFVNLTEKGFYTDLIFHRVISGFMIQDGCPIGDGTGDPGYSFDDEFTPELRHNFPGVLSMANAGPNTNGSQYFITVEPTSWLDDHHTIFGRIIDGMDIVYAISEVDTDENDKPISDVNLTISIVESNPQLSLNYPSDGVKIEKGRNINIEWNSDFIADAKIEFSSDNGINWTSITDSIPSGEETLAWTVPDIISAECIIKISSLKDGSIFTQNLFEIRNKPIEYTRFEMYNNVSPADNNPDNIIMLNKRIRFKIKVNNTLTQTIPTLNIYAQSDDNDLLITENNVSINDIAIGEEKWSEQEFEIEIPENFPGNGKLHFSLYGTSPNIDGNFWLGDFDIPILKSFPFLTIDDNNDGNSNGNNNKILEQGETIELKIPIDNKSSLTLFEVAGKLTTNANYINIWNDISGTDGIVYDTTLYNSGNPINPNSSFVQQDNSFVFDYNANEPFKTDFIVRVNGYINEVVGTNWDNGGIKLKWGIPITLNSTYPPAKTNTVLNKNTSFKILQNKNSNSFIITFNGNEVKDNILNIINIQGSLVYSKKIYNSYEEINISPLKNGIYFVKFNNYVQKIIILK